MSTITILFDNTLAQREVESNLLVLPALGKSFADADGNSYKYEYLQFEGAQLLNGDPNVFMNTLPTATSTDPTCLAFGAFQFVVDFAHPSVDLGQLDEPEVDELDVLDSAITFATDEDAQTECPNGA